MKSQRKARRKGILSILKAVENSAPPENMSSYDRDIDLSNLSSDTSFNAEGENAELFLTIKENAQIVELNKELDQKESQLRRSLSAEKKLLGDMSELRTLLQKTEFSLAQSKANAETLQAKLTKERTLLSEKESQVQYVTRTSILAGFFCSIALVVLICLLIF